MPREIKYPRSQNDTRQKDFGPMGFCSVCKADVPAAVVEGKLVCANPRAILDPHFLETRVTVFSSPDEEAAFRASLAEQPVPRRARRRRS